MFRDPLNTNINIGLHSLMLVSFFLIYDNNLILYHGITKYFWGNPTTFGRNRNIIRIKRLFFGFGL
jgi:hypothetical protein